MKTDLEQQVSEARSLLDVLLILKSVTMKDTHVATLAYVERNISPFDGKSSVWSCRPFPLEQGQSEFRIEAYCFSEDASFPEGSIVLITFADRNFINSLQASSASPKPTPDQGNHSLKYGVISSSPYLGLTEEEKEEILDI